MGAIAMSTDDRIKPEPVPVKPVIAGSYREMVGRWLFDQSVPVVLLFLILAATIYGIPNVALPRIEQGYKTNSDAMERTMKIYIESSKEQMKLILDSHDRDRKAFERVIDRREFDRNNDN